MDFLKERLVLVTQKKGMLTAFMVESITRLEGS